MRFIYTLHFQILVQTSFLEITSCPNDIKYTVELGTTDKQVTWLDPTAYDPHGPVTLVSQSHRPGQAFEVGEYAVVYEFANQAGHAAVCNFTVEITTGEIFLFSILQMVKSESFRV